VVRQVLTESLVLAALGGLFGLLLSGWLLDGLVALAPSDTPRLDAVRVDVMVLSYVAGLVLLTALVFGLAPAVHPIRRNVVDRLKGGGARGSLESRRAVTGRSAFIVTQMALALTLLAGAGLLMRSFANLNEVDPGFRPERVLTASVSLPAAAYQQDDQVRAFFTALLDRLRATAGVEAAGLVSVLPFSGTDTDTTFTIADRPPPTEPGSAPTAWFRIVSPGFFEAIRMRLEAGRFIEGTDTATSERVAVINRALANRYFGGRDPVGQRILLGPGRSHVVVGVAGDVHHRALSAEPLPQMYLADAQFPRRQMTIVLKAAGDAGALASAVRASVASLDPSLPVFGVNTMESLIAESLAIARLVSLLMAAFAAAALLLTSVGVYGLMAYVVAERTREFGIRAALGASAGDVVRLVLGRAAWLIALALVLGVAAANGVSRLIGALLFGVSPGDAATLAATAGLLSIVALAAAWLPARRAMRISPVVALRG
jgi:putative ABC transport system permease protein